MLSSGTPRAGATHHQTSGDELRQRAAYRWRASRGVLVEVEAHLIGSPFSGRRRRAAIQNRFAHRQANVHRRTLTAWRWAIKPSDSARVSTVSARRRKPLRVTVCTLMHFTKSVAERPPRLRAQPPVGRTWLLPVA